MFHFLLLLPTLFAIGQSSSFMTKNCNCYDYNMYIGKSRFKRTSRKQQLPSSVSVLASARWKTIPFCLMIPRGGGGGTNDEQTKHHLNEPLVDTTSVALALRHTCETNRRLRTEMFISYKTREEEEAMLADTEQPFQSTQLVSSQHNPPPPPEVQSVSEEELTEERLKRELTVFHSKIPDDVDLFTFLETLLSAIGLGENDVVVNEGSTTNPMEDEKQIILSLALLYLDRSTLQFDNVDPQTGQVWSPQRCPYLLPQTIHRLLLASFSLATKCIRGDKSVSNLMREAANNAMHDEKSTISISDMEQMESWMINSLGLHDTANNGISHDEIGIFIRKWGATFYPHRLEKHDQSRIKRLEGFWKDRTAVFGGTNYQHGHGNHWSDPSHQTKQQQQLEYNSNYYPSSGDALNHPENRNTNID